jgi:trimeric autotransporter adhesin
MSSNNSINQSIISLQAIEAVQQYLSQFATTDDFESSIEISFGTKIGAAAIRQQWLSGDFSLIPKIEVLSNGELGTANGAYAASLDRIFVSSDFLAQHEGDVAAVSELLLEEIGHKIDRVLNGNVDSSGDEGAIFRLLATGQGLSAETLAELRMQDDHAVVMVDGLSVAVEKQDFTGTAGNDTLIGTSGNDRLFGLAGNDSLDGGAGDDYLDGGAGADTYIGGLGNDTATLNYSAATTTVTVNYTNLTGGTGFEGDTIKEIENVGVDSGNGDDSINISATTGINAVRAGAGNDIIISGAGQDYLEGGDGDDILRGGAGDDNRFENYPAGAGGTILRTGGLYGGAGNDQLFGEAGNDYLDGGTGDDILNGGTGDDLLVGGDGNDTYIINANTDIGTDTITETATGGIDTLSFQPSTTAINVNLSQTATQTVAPNVKVASAGNTTAGFTGLNYIENVIGGSGADTITGNTLNNRLDGGAGADTMSGGTGDDTYVVDNIGDIVTEAAGAGTDTVESSITYTLTSNVENLTLTGTADINGTGNGLDNIITGNGGNNSLNGLVGNDTLNGGAGNDTLDGGVGADAMNGGAGNDTYIVDNAGDLVTEAVIAGTDTVQSSISYTLTANVENLTLTGTAITGTGNDLDNTITGNASDNTLNGGAGNDTLDGGTGADAMNGSAGNDTYIVENTGDIVTEAANEGTDTVQSSINYTLTDNVENLTLTGTGDINGTGNALDNIIIGNSSNNTIKSGAGNDTLNSGAGDDKLNPGTGADKIDGGAGNDTLTINNSTDTADTTITYTTTTNGTITGGSNNGTTFQNIEGVEITTGAGNDNINVSAATTNFGVTVYGGAGNDTIVGSATAFSQSLSGDDGNDNITGGNIGDYLYGGAGNDTLDGGTGSDAMSGGTGDDTYIVDNIGDTATELANQGIDTIQSSVTYVLSNNSLDVENLILTGTADLNGTGNALDNTITGNAGNNTLDGGAGNDTLIGGAGADTMIGGTGNDTYIVDNAGDIVTEAPGAGTDTVQSSISYTLTDNVENLTLTGTGDINGTGNGLANTITGNAGNNILDGGAGADTMIGGAGNDTYIVDNVGDIVTEAPGAGTDTVQSSISYTLTDNVENLTLTGTADINGTGNVLNNTITGNAGNNILDGGAGADTMIGGFGNDTYIVDNAGDIVTEAAGAGTDTVQSSISYTLTDNVENLTLTGTADINGTGNGLDNTIIGNAGNNILDGGTGADTMIGGVGNDTYTVDNAGDIVTEATGAGTDTVQSSIGYTLTDNVENLTLTGTGNINGIGNALDNIITGTAGNNILDGGTGADTMIGGLGNDTYIVDNAGDIVTEAAGVGTDTVQSSISYTLTDNVENLTLTGTGDINGTGNALDNIITGNAGNNILDGGAGADTMIGGAGNDIFVVDNVGDVVQANNTGTNTVQSSISYTLDANVQNLTLTGTAINGAGNALNNTITGNAGNNILDGGAGADTMIGGAGNDIFVVDNVGDIVTEAAGAGTDTVQSSISYTLTDNVENLTLTGTGDINGTGNALDNTITGNAGNNILDGGAGADTMIGGAGNDTYIVDNAGDIVTEATGAGTDTVQSSIGYTLTENVENLTLTGTAITGTGNALDNIVTGNAGNNILDGGAGADTMIGGAGNDTYIVDNAGDIVTEAPGAGTDTVQSSISYTLTDNVENLTLTGTSDLNGTGNGLDNIITGNAGKNILDGGAGKDTMIGGLGNDTYIVDNAGDIVTEAAGAGTDNVQSSVSYALTDNVENLTLTGTASINGTGNALDNTITGNAGNNILDGGAGADTMIGGAGNDTYVVDNIGDVVQANSTGTNTVQSSINYALGANVQNLTLTGTSDINGTGNGLDNTITGNAGNNILDGGAGADTMIGGLGSDTYIVDNAGDIVTEAVDGGTDTVQSSTSYTLTDNVENLTLTGTGDINGTGNGLANTITGNSGNNILTGGGGADKLSGGAGNDTYLVSRTLGGGTSIDDLSGTNDTLSLIDGASLTTTDISRSGTTLLIDIDRNSVFDIATDLSIKNFFANAAGSKIGNGFIENVDGLSGSVVLTLYTPTRNDFNGDKKSDILWLNDYGSVALWQMDGSSRTSGSLTSVPDIDASWKNAGTGDFNGDSKADILWRNDNGAVAIWQMDGSTVSSSRLTSTPAVDNSWKINGTADFNGDGKTDILWRNTNGAVAVWQMDSSTVISSTLTSTPAVDNSWKINGTADFNGDGQSDILWRNDDGSIAIWQMNGSNVASSNLTSTSSLDNSWKINGTGDFNGDGKADILWRNDNGAIAIWRMNGSTVVDSSLTSTSALDASWTLNQVGDFNGDRKSDLLWRNDSGASVVWQMNGSTIVSSTLTSIAADSSSWKVAAPIV